MVPYVRVAVLAFFSGLLLTLAGCVDHAPQQTTTSPRHGETTMDESTTSDPLTAMEELGRLSLPTEVVDVASYVEPGGMDALVALRFSLPADALPSFLAANGYPPTLEPLGHVPSLFGAPHGKIAGWPPLAEWDALLDANPSAFASVSAVEPGFVRQLIVDKRDPASLVIYLIHFET